MRERSFTRYNCRDSNNHIIEEGVINSGFSKTEHYKYDKNGTLIQIREVNNSGNSGETMSFTDFNYNDKGELIAETYKSITTQKNPISNATKHIISNRSIFNIFRGGDKTQSIDTNGIKTYFNNFYSSKGKIDRVLNENDQVTNKYVYNKYGDLISIWESTFSYTSDKKTGRLVKDKLLYFTWSKMNVYNDRRLLIYEYIANSIDIKKIEYRYDHNNRLIQKKIYQNDKLILNHSWTRDIYSTIISERKERNYFAKEIIQIEYTLDKFNNWQECVIIKNGKTARLRRTILYFEVS